MNIQDEIRQLIANEESKRKKKSATRYVKPQSIKDFEKELFEYDCWRYPNIPRECVAKFRFEDKTANGLTNLIVKWLNFKGGNARRVNTGGIFDHRTGKYRRSGSTNGAADISATWHGKSLQIEIKAGKDKPRPDQLKQQERERAAGGIYEFVHSFDEFLSIIQTI